jgi:hypothetical protein
MKKFIENLGKRIAALILKLAGFEGLFFAIATVALFKGKIPPDIWRDVGGICAGIKTFQLLKGIAADKKLTDQADQGVPKP